jgi:hypothetical protein
MNFFSKRSGTTKGPKKPYSKIIHSALESDPETRSGCTKHSRSTDPPSPINFSHSCFASCAPSSG